MKKLVTSLGLAALFAASGAQAASITFTNPSSNSGGGVTATTTSTGGSLSFGGDGTFGDGLGIGSGLVKGGIGAVSSGILGLGTSYTASETVTVTFSEEVTLTSLMLGNWENNVLGFGDRASLSYSGGASGSGSIDLNGSDGNLGLTGAIDFFNTNLSLTQFTLTPTVGGTNSDGASVQTAFRLNAVDFDVAPVPLPAAVWLFGSALAGLTVVGRRRRQTT